MGSTLLAVGFDVHDPARVAPFWAGLLGRDVVTTDDGALLRDEGGQVALAFAPSRAPKVGPNRVHLHLTSTSDADQRRVVEAALGLGARHLDVGQRPEEGHVVLADPGDNEFCVIEPDNSFLAGCGLLGEVACDGGREVGLFWSSALAWPLVWDHDEETAIQSPLGGTKIAWGGPTAGPTPAGGQRFELACAAAGVRDEVERLVSLGATQVGDAALVDPGGQPFRVLPVDDGLVRG